MHLRNFTFPAAWKIPLIGLLLTQLTILLAYQESGLSMVKTWLGSDTFLHCFLVLPISLWLIAARRKALSRLTPHPGFTWLIPLFGCIVIGLLARASLTNVVSQFTLVALLILCVPLFLGTQVFRTILFPLLFLFFNVPTGDFLLPALMSWTADFTVSALQVSGIPVYREGLQFIIPSGHWSVIEACSGIRYLISSLMVGSLFAYLNFSSWKRRSLFILVTATVPLLANWLRAYVIVMLAHFSGNRLATGFDHLVYGWVVFGLVIGLTFWLGIRWAEPGLRPAEQVTQKQTVSGSSTPRYVFLSLTCIFLLILPYLWLDAVQNKFPHRMQRITPPFSPAWSSTPRPLPDWQPIYQNPDQEHHWGLRNNQEQSIGLYIAYYQKQNAERKLVSSGNVLTDRENPHWSQSGGSPVEIPFTGGRASCIEITLKYSGSSGISNGEGHLVWQCYWVDQRFVGNPYVAKWHAAWQFLKGNGEQAAVVIIYTPLLQATDPRAVLSAFLGQNALLIDHMLREASPSDTKENF